MRYFIGYLIPESVAGWQNKLTDEISEEFKTWKISERIPPHITISRPFNSENIEVIKKLLANWAENKSVPGNFTLSGFDHFTDRVVYINVEPETAVSGAIIGLREQVNNIPEIKREDFPYHPHSTVAYQLPSVEIEKIWEYVQKLEKPFFVIPFDNVTIFRSTGYQKWEIDETFRLAERK